MHIADRIAEVARRTGAHAVAAQAALLGIPTSTLYRWLRGERIPSLSHLVTLSRHLGVSVSQLLSRVDDASVLTRADTKMSKKEKK